MRYVYFLCEVGAREVAPRFALAALLSARGYRTLIGHKLVLHEMLDRLPPGVVVYKDGTEVSHRYFAKARQNGHKCVAVDEEYAYVAEVGWAVNHLCIPETDNYVDAFVTSCDASYNLVRSLTDKVVFAGNLRTAVAEELKGLRQSRPRKSDSCSILINSNVGFAASNFTWFPYLYENFRLSKEKETFRGASEKTFRNIEVSFSRLQALSDCSDGLLAAGHTVCVRPHPDESRDFFANWFPEGVTIDNKNRSSLLSIYDSDIVVSFGCTTLVEATLMGCPVVSIAGPTFLARTLADVTIPRTSASEVFSLVSDYECLSEECAKISFPQLARGDVFGRWITLIEQLSSGVKAGDPAFEQKSLLDNLGVRINFAADVKNDGILNRWGEIDLPGMLRLLKLLDASGDKRFRPKNVIHHREAGLIEVF